MAKKHIVGTITGVFDGALDGMEARLVRRRRLGYTVELLESKEPWHKGDIVHLSPAEFLIAGEPTGARPHAAGLLLEEAADLGRDAALAGDAHAEAASCCGEG